LVAHLDGEAHRTDRRDPFVFGDLAAAAPVGPPPVALRRLLRGTVEAHPWLRASRLVELDVELVAAGDRAVHRELHARHPAPDIEALAIGVDGPSGHLHRRLVDGGLILGDRNGYSPG